MSMLARTLPLLTLLAAGCELGAGTVKEAADVILHNGEAGSESCEHAEPVVHLPQQQSATVRGDPTTVETAPHIPPSQTVKFQLAPITLCRHRPLLLRVRKCLAALTLCTKERPISILMVRFTG
jgi:hypothetical protein